jgi:hypothetical protein
MLTYTLNRLEQAKVLDSVSLPKVMKLVKKNGVPTDVTKSGGLGFYVKLKFLQKVYSLSPLGAFQPLFNF